jgi:murein L,D-transpeptidase YafK
MQSLVRWSILLIGISLVALISYPFLRKFIKRANANSIKPNISIENSTVHTEPTSIPPTSLLTNQSFKHQQLTFPRVQVAFKEKEQILKDLFKDKGFSYPPKRVFIRVFKKEQVLELWIADKDRDSFQLLKTYNVCASSGTLGPKRREGDRQVPEGFYHIERFNPKSNYYLSLGINYPNQSDRILGGAGRLGGDIFIHGDCVTIGCVPVTDEGIKEIYLLAVEAKNVGQERIPVHIFPTRLSSSGIKELEESFSGDKSSINFWKNLKVGYDLFEKNHNLPQVSVNREGKYLFD